MIRRLLACGLSLSVQAGAVCAIFVHEHVDDERHTGAVHAHLSGHAVTHVDGDGVAVEPADRDHAIYLQAVVAVESPLFYTPDIPRAIFTPTPFVRRAPRAPVIVAHGHDPPLAQALDSRPPPLLLS